MAEHASAVLHVRLTKIPLRFALSKTIVVGVVPQALVNDDCDNTEGSMFDARCSTDCIKYALCNEECSSMRDTIPITYAKANVNARHVSASCGRWIRRYL